MQESASMTGRVWVSEREDAWEAAEVVHRTMQEVEVIMDANKERRSFDLSKAVVVPRNPPHLEGTHDLITLQFLDEPNILHNLKVRHQKEEIYTNTGPILIAMNPWRTLNIYSAEYMDAYNSSALNQTVDTLPPHIYRVADAAYRAMLRDQRNQSILVSGESGAGKTESTKFVMRFLAHVSSGHCRDDGVASAPGEVQRRRGGVCAPRLRAGAAAAAVQELATEQKVLDSNPLLEAFGNAKTLRNDNSSRFGKYIDLHFGGNGSLIGGAIQTYLLEKARVVQQARGERNFHIFYQLTDGAQDLDPETARMLHLDSSPNFLYLSGLINSRQSPPPPASPTLPPASPIPLPIPHVPVPCKS
jgi:myosin-5